jgi:hypothetical protein
VRLDHVVYGVRDLDAAQQRIERELGLAVEPGGRHEGQGTHNRIVPLRGAYLELLAIADRAEAEASSVGRLLLDRIERGDGLIAWACTVDDVDAVAERLGTELYVVRRDGHEGRLTGVVEALSEPCLPFFGASGKRERPGEAELTWLEVSGDAARIHAWLGPGHGLPLRIVDGAPALRAVGIGDAELRP